jgi:hypothetical protein
VGHVALGFVVVGAVLSTAYSVRFIRGVFGTKKDCAPSHVHHAPSFLLVAPVVLLSIASVVAGIFAQQTGHLFDAVATTLSPTASGKLALWPGVNTALVVSVIVVGVGAVIGALVPFALTPRALLVPGDKVYLWLLEGIFTGSKKITKYSQNGSLHTYIVVMLSVMSAALAYSLVSDQLPHLDNLVIETALAGKGTGSATNATTLTFTVTEPNGFTFIENLYRAVASIYKKNNLKGNYVDADYCICIRFYGYNDSGELIQVGRTTNPSGGRAGVAVSTDVRAVVEKFITFKIGSVNTKIVSRAVEYQIEGSGVGTSTAFSSQRGTIPFPYELAGSTVGELLNGRPVGTNYSKTDGRPNTSNPPSANPTQPAEPTIGAGVDANGNFTGDITPGSFSSVIGA